MSDTLRASLGDITTPDLGDNLAATLCSAFDSYEDDDDPETGWSWSAVRGRDQVLDAIHAHYEPTIAALRAEVAVAQGRRATAYAAGLEAAAREVSACASIVDYPNVYMGGPSRNARRIADAFAGAIRALSPDMRNDD